MISIIIVCLPFLAGLIADFARINGYAVDDVIPIVRKAALAKEARDK